MKVSELEGAELDYWVAKAEGYMVETLPITKELSWFDRKGFIDCVKSYSPSTDWAQGGPIIERENIELRNDIRHLNLAHIGGFHPNLVMPGRTPLIAAMRCYVASRFGVEVPE